MIGKIVNAFCDQFLPDVVGDIAGAAIDAFSGNPLGAVTNGIDALDDLLPSRSEDKTKSQQQPQCSPIQITYVFSPTTWAHNQEQ